MWSGWVLMPSYGNDLLPLLDDFYQQHATPYLSLLGFPISTLPDAAYEVISSPNVGAATSNYGVYCYKTCWALDQAHSAICCRTVLHDFLSTFDTLEEVL